MTTLVAVLAVAVTAWFGAGTAWNVRRGNAVMRWLQDGLPLIGERTTVRWLGSSAVELGIRQAKPPFATATLVVFLEPRDVPWWPLSRGLGRRDTLIVRATLRRAPDADLEVLAPGTWSSRDALRRLGGDWTRRAPDPDGALPTWFRPPATPEQADALVELARRSGLTVWRLSLRRSEPHVQLHLALPPAGASSRDLFQAVRQIGERASS